MPVSIVKETIELPSVTCDSDGNAWLTKKINLKPSKRHMLQQVDYFVDRYPTLDGQYAIYEFVISAYPSIPTNMNFSNNASYGVKSYPAGGDDSVLFKAHLQVYDQDTIASPNRADSQFPSETIAAMNKSYFYTDHIYINLCVKAGANEVVGNVAMSFMFVLDDKGTSSLEHSLGVLSEQHDAMCALIMSNGRMQTINTLRGNIFPMWRYGGIRPAYMTAESFWLKLSTTDDEPMATTAFIRGSIGGARQMGAFDAAFGQPKYPDWIKMNLNQGLTSGPIRPDPVPLKYADNGNTRMF